MQVQIEHSIQNSQSFFAIIHNNNNISPLYNKNNINEKEINGKAFFAPFCTALVPPLFKSNNLRLHFGQMSARLPRVLDNDGR